MRVRKDGDFIQLDPAILAVANPELYSQLAAKIDQTPGKLIRRDDVVSAGHDVFARYMKQATTLVENDARSKLIATGTVAGSVGAAVGSAFGLAGLGLAGGTGVGLIVALIAAVPIIRGFARSEE